MEIIYEAWYDKTAPMAEISKLSHVHDTIVGVFTFLKYFFFGEIIVCIIIVK